MKVTFRKACVSDKAALLTLLSNRQKEANALHNEKGNVVPSEGAVIFDEIMNNVHVTIFVGEQNGIIVATLTSYVLPRIRLGGYFAFFEDVLVAKEYRGSGIGNKLLDYAISEMKKNNKIKKIKIGSRKDETGLHSFYEKIGFVFKEKLFQKSLDNTF